MKTKSLLIAMVFYAGSFICAQKKATICEDSVITALGYVYGLDKVKQDVTKGNQLLKNLSEQGCVLANYELGKLYYISSYGSHTTSEENMKSIFNFYSNSSEAFSYLNKAVSQGHVKSLTLLGHLFRNGYGCNLNYNKALDLYHLASNMGDEEASFLIGYSYFKGLGTPGQDYTKAIEWFKKTNYVMANHFLAICNFFGHGMPTNQNRAYTKLIENQDLPNSVVLLQYLEKIYPNGFSGTDYNIKDLNLINKVIKSKLAYSQRAKKRRKGNIKKYTKNDLTGKWIGTLAD